MSERRDPSDRYEEKLREQRERQRLRDLIRLNEPGQTPKIQVNQASLRLR